MTTRQNGCTQAKRPNSSFRDQDASALGSHDAEPRNLPEAVQPLDFGGGGGDGGSLGVGGGEGGVRRLACRTALR